MSANWSRFLNWAFAVPHPFTLRLRITKLVLWTIVGMAGAVALARFTRGLGASTSLDDANPWGLWIGFDVMSGVALAAGGFVVAGAVYVFHLHRYHIIVRSAVLTAFLGYAAVAVGLLFDLGRPWNIWRPILHWNPHSALFEVAWCVMLYLTVLSLEFLPAVLEKYPRMYRLLGWLRKATLPLVILGIMLSTLHQSSLGTLFVIMPYRLHELWHTTWLPLLFFVSAIGLGLMMVIFESTVTSWLYDRPPETRVLRGLAKGAVGVLSLYLVLRLASLAANGRLGLMFEPAWITVLFWTELGMSTILPIVLLSIPAIRRRRVGQFSAATLGVLGFVLNRLSVGGVAHVGTVGFYFPSWMEILITAGVVSGFALIFFFCIDHFNIFPEEEEAHLHRRTAPLAGWGALGGARRYSLGAVVGFAAVMAMLPEEAVHGTRPERTPVHRSLGGDIVFIDGDMNGEGVIFTHEHHIEFLERREPCAGCHRHEPGEDNPVACNLCHDDERTLEDGFEHEMHAELMIDEAAYTEDRRACKQCHHLNLPLDRFTPCRECHQDMWLETDLFDHDLHAAQLGGDERACERCHGSDEVPRPFTETPACLDCHPHMLPPGGPVDVENPREIRHAPGYVAALHRQCIRCHRGVARETGKPQMVVCLACHRELPVEGRLELEQFLYNPDRVMKFLHDTPIAPALIEQLEEKGYVDYVLEAAPEGTERMPELPVKE